MANPKSQFPKAALALLLVLTLSLATPAASAARAEAPELTVGDFRAVRYHDGTVETTRVAGFETVEVGGREYQAVRMETTGGREDVTQWLRVSDLALLQERTQLNDLTSTTRFAEPCEQYDFPLTKGKTWISTCEIVTTVEMTGQGSREESGWLNTSYRVGDSSFVQTPAATFDAYRVQAVQPGGNVQLTWFSEQACGPVKVETLSRTGTLTDHRCQLADFSTVTATTGLLSPYLGATASLVVTFLLVAFLVLNFVMAVGGLMSYLMRKVMARIHTRIGPNRVGPFGILQFLADGIKMIGKEDILPAKADKWAYRLAPFFVLIPLMMAFAPMPFGEGIILIDLKYGFLFILAISAITPIGEILAGWGSNNKYSTYGAVRAASMDVSYEIPMVISAISVVLMTGSLSTIDIVEAQQPLWFFFLQPLGAFVFFATALAKAGVLPTDLAESESELIAGYFTEYGAMRFGMFQLNVFVGVVFVSMLTVLLFFGGWTIPFVENVIVFGFDLLPLLSMIVFLAKVTIFTLLVLIVWFTLPRLRPDQFLSLGWKVLFPLALLNLVVTAGVVYYLGGI